MSKQKTAYRYSLAIFGIAEELNKIDDISNDFLYIENCIAQLRELKLFLKSPVIKNRKKSRMVSEIFQNKVSDITLKFLLLLTSKDREELLPDIIKQFFILRDNHFGIMNVTARSAIKFSREEEQLLISRLEQVTKKKVRLNTALDSSLLGGFVVQHEDTVWDASVRRQLENLRQKLIEGIS
jgi:F-type H+-transporting ATPase subunit delta